MINERQLMYMMGRKYAVGAPAENGQPPEETVQATVIGVNRQEETILLIRKTDGADDDEGENKIEIKIGDVISGHVFFTPVEHLRMRQAAQASKL